MESPPPRPHTELVKYEQAHTSKQVRIYQFGQEGAKDTHALSLYLRAQAWADELGKKRATAIGRWLHWWLLRVPGARGQGSRLPTALEPQ